jgi:hypothetical protein
MAEKISPAEVNALKQARTPDNDGAAEEFALLYPDVEAVIAGETITVREFRGLEGLKATTLARPFLNELRDLAINDLNPPSIESLSDVVGRHADLWVGLMASVCGKYPQRRSVEWVSALSAVDFARLQDAFWRANGFFFVRRLVIEAQTKAVAGNLGRSATQSSISSAPASEPISTTSASDTPGDKSAITLN